MYLAERSAPGGRETRKSGAARVVSGTVLALGAVSLVTDVSSEMVTAVLPLYLVAGLGLSPLGFGVLDGLYNGVSALVQLLGGHLADRARNHKLLAALGYGLSALCKPLLLLTHTLTPLGAVLALERTGKGLRTAPRDALISLNSTPHNRGRAFGVHRALDTTGALLGPLTAYLILRAATDGYDAVFGVSGCIAALGVLLLLLFVPGTRGPAPQHPADLRAALTLLRDRRLRALTGAAALLALTTVSDSFLYLMLQKRADLDTRWFPLLPLGTATVFLLLAVPAGLLADRIGRTPVFLTGHALLLAGYTLLLAGPATPALPCLVLALHGAFYAATDGVLPAAVADTVPEHLRGTGLALTGTAQALARFLCSLGIGAAWTAYGPHTTLTAATAALTLAAAIATPLLRGRTP